MKKISRLSIILLSLVVLIPIINYLANKNGSKLAMISASTPSCKSDCSNTVVYSSEGTLKYRLIAQHVEYFSDEGVIWFHQLMMTTFNTDKAPAWSITSDRAKLTNDRILYLYGHVEMNALNINIQLRKITTNNATINLITQDVTCQDIVKLYGTTFNSSSLKMRGNLCNKNTELIEKVITSYEIQTKKTQF